MKLLLDKTAVSGTKAIRGTKRDLHGTPPTDTHQSADKTRTHGANHYAISRILAVASWCKHGGYDGILGAAQKSLSRLWRLNVQYVRTTTTIKASITGKCTGIATVLTPRRKILSCSSYFPFSIPPSDPEATPARLSASGGWKHRMTNESRHFFHRWQVWNGTSEYQL